MKRILLGLLALLLCLPAPAMAWGTMGHRLVARLAEPQLTPATRAAIAQLLADEADPSLAGIANWADQLRENDPHLGKRSAPWHYVNLGEDDCRYQAWRDCPDGDCVIAAIRMQVAILADRRQPQATRLQALKFVVHLVGDVHQPLHAGYAHDKGGNSVQINLDGKGSNLHSLWDSGMLKQTGMSEDAWLAEIQALPPLPPLAPRRASGLPEAQAWAQASCSIVKQDGFYPARAVIGPAYLQSWRAPMQQQLQRAGADLAATLNAALDR